MLQRGRGRSPAETDNQICTNRQHTVKFICSNIFKIIQFALIGQHTQLSSLEVYLLKYILTDTLRTHISTYIKFSLIGQHIVNFICSNIFWQITFAHISTYILIKHPSLIHIIVFRQCFTVSNHYKITEAYNFLNGVFR